MAVVLVANPGSASRKYAIYDGEQCLAKLHFENVANKIVCTIEAGQKQQLGSKISHLSFSASQLPDIIAEHKLLPDDKTIECIALRVVAPTDYFQKDRKLDEAARAKLASLESSAPLHINAALQEANLLTKYFPGVRLAGISDSAFHSSLIEPAKHYGLPLQEADRLGLKRFGYQGLSVESVVASLKADDKLPDRLIVCHLGSGSSVTAVRNGKSIDTSMGYSPLEGVMMSTRSGSLDVTAALYLKQEHKLDDTGLLDRLNQHAGLLGVSGVSSDIRELLEIEDKQKDAALALEMYVYKIQQAIGQMAASLGGLDVLVFTGTVGERSRPVRQRIIQHLLFLGLALDPAKNHTHVEPGQTVTISPAHHPVKIYIVPANEDAVMARRALAVDA